MNKLIIPIWLCFTLVICSGCGLTLNSSQYAYTPNEKFIPNIQALPITVAINYLEDLRGKESYEYFPLLFLPLMPYANAHFDRPETSQKFEIKGLKPDKDFANALLQELKFNNLFSEIVLVQKTSAQKADLVVTGRINKASIDTKITWYGMSMLGILPWVAGFPEGKVYNALDIQYEMRRTTDNAIVWTCDVKGDWNKLFAFYYNYSKDEPYTGMNEILRKGLHDGLSTLAEDIKNKPISYWKQ